MSPALQCLVQNSRPLSPRRRIGPSRCRSHRYEYGERNHTGYEEGIAHALCRWHIGGWGNPYEGGGQPGKGTTQYSLSPNRQRPFAGFLTKGVWNSYRRVKNQFFYVVPPFVAAYGIMQWATKRLVPLRGLAAGQN
jgi:ubiquinol-cytochrome c reductase subunit 8